eukprot:XP_011618300.1 PREDICTED: nesprin-1-like [Takifugu rubripes]
MKFLQFLDRHFRTLQYLSQSAPQRWEGGLQEEVARLRRRGLAKATTMQEILRVWSQWEEDSAWADSLLRPLQTSFPRMQEEGASEEQISEKLSVYKGIREVLENNEARFGRMLEAGLWLQKAGCKGVGVSTANLVARWKTLFGESEQEHSRLEKRWKLRCRFLHDFDALVEWMGGARRVIDTLDQLSGLEDVDADLSQRHFVQAVELTKDLESRSGLKAAVVGAGAQMLQLRGDDEGDETPDPAQSCLQAQLTQVELDWSGLLADVPAVQTALQERWLKMVGQQGALQVLQTWVDSAETRLEELLSRTRSSTTELSQQLKDCRDLRTEMVSHQATLDSVDQPSHGCSTEHDHRRRCEQNQFAEEQGGLSRRWFRLQARLQCRVQEAQQELRSGAEQEVRLQRISRWAADQNRWVLAARTPSSRAELRRSRAACQALQLDVRQQLALLQEFSGEDQMCSRLFSQTQMLIQTCEGLGSQAASADQELAAAQQLWEHLEEELSQLAMKTSSTCQSLRLHQPQICLQAHTDVHQQLQLLHEATSSSSSEWRRLIEAVSALSGVVSPAAAALLAERAERERDRWSALRSELQRQLRKSGRLLQVWEGHCGRAAALTRRLQTLRRDAAAMLGGAPAEGDVEQTAERIRRVEVRKRLMIRRFWWSCNIQTLPQNLLQTADVLQADLQGALEASRSLTDLLEPPAACLVQSELRLLSRDIQETIWNLRERLGQLQVWRDEG